MLMMIVRRLNPLDEDDNKVCSLKLEYESLAGFGETNLT